MLKKILTFVKACEFLESHYHEAHDLYIVRDYTARQLASHFNISFNAQFPKACLKVFGTKGKGLGGARMGSGNRKEGREKRRRKVDYHQIVVNLSPSTMQVLKDSGESYVNYIERAILFYNKAQKALTASKEDHQA